MLERLKPSDGYLSLRPGTQFLKRGRSIVVTFPSDQDAADFMLWAKWVGRSKKPARAPESVVGSMLRDLVKEFMGWLDRALLPSKARG